MHHMSLKPGTWVGYLELPRDDAGHALEEVEYTFKMRESDGTVVFDILGWSRLATVDAGPERVDANIKYVTQGSPASVHVPPARMSEDGTTLPRVVCFTCTLTKHEELQGHLGARSRRVDFILDDEGNLLVTGLPIARLTHGVSAAEDVCLLARPPLETQQHAAKLTFDSFVRRAEESGKGRYRQGVSPSSRACTIM
mmetsp:Transcript_22737/g.61618  ORF Transcript_22737/g.61618 Transcript_22737/m.61618 type:complete len:197 (-) Transcript_22737:271-861(-)